MTINWSDRDLQHETRPWTKEADEQRHDALRSWESIKLPARIKRVLARYGVHPSEAKGLSWEELIKWQRVGPVTVNAILDWAKSVRDDRKTARRNR
jgi:hypothetical protein